MNAKFVWLLIAVLGFTPSTAEEEAPPEETPAAEEAAPSEEVKDTKSEQKAAEEAPPVEEKAPEEAPKEEASESFSKSDKEAEQAPEEETPAEDDSKDGKKSDKKTKKSKKFAGHNPTWSSHDSEMQVITKEGEYIPAKDVLSSKNHTTTAGRVVVANAKKFTSYVTLFKSPGGRCYSVVLPMKLENVKVGQTMPLLPGYKHQRPYVPELSGFKDVLRGHGCRKWNKVNEVAVLFPAFRSAKDARPQIPLWYLKGGKTLVSKKDGKPELTKLNSQTDMYTVPGLLQLEYEGKAHISTTVLKNGKPVKISAERTIFKDDEGACVIAEGEVKKIKAGYMYSGAPLMHKYNRDYTTILRDLRGDDWIEPFACKNIARVPVLAAVYDYGK